MGGAPNGGMAPRFGGSGFRLGHPASLCLLHPCSRIREAFGTVVCAVSLGLLKEARRAADALAADKSKDRGSPPPPTPPFNMDSPTRNALASGPCLPALRQQLRLVATLSRLLRPSFQQDKGLEDDRKVTVVAWKRDRDVA